MAFKPTLLKILFILPDVGEKESSKLLEESTSPLFTKFGCLCSFTVVPNAFVGLEYTEYTTFDVIFCHSNLYQLNASNMLRVLRNIGNTTPVVNIIETTQENTFDGFDDVLRFPFASRDVCGVIEKVLYKCRNTSFESRDFTAQRSLSSSSSSSSSSSPSSSSSSSTTTIATTSSSITSASGTSTNPWNSAEALAMLMATHTHLSEQGSDSIDSNASNNQLT